MTKNRAPQTIAAGNGIGQDSAFGSVVPPIYLSSTFTFEGFARARQYRLHAIRQSDTRHLGRHGRPVGGRSRCGRRVNRHGGHRPHALLPGARRSDHRAARLLRRHLASADRTAGEATVPGRLHRFRRRHRAGFSPVAFPAAGSDREPAIPSCGSSTFAGSPRWRGQPGRKPSSTTPSCPRRCSSRSSWARIWSCIRRPSSSTAIPTWSAASSSRPVKGMSTHSWPGRT